MLENISFEDGETCSDDPTENYRETMPRASLGKLTESNKAREWRENEERRCAQAKKELLDAFSKNNASVDTGDALGLMDEEGLPTTDYIIFEEKEWPAIRKILIRNKVAPGVGRLARPEFYGWYSHGLDLSFIVRDSGPEGELQTSLRQVHEWGHGTSEYDFRYCVRNNRSLLVERVGFNVRRGFRDGNEDDNWWFGAFLEEGFPAALEGKFLDKHRDIGRLREMFKDYDGLELDDTIPIEMGVEGIPVFLPIPAKYFFEDPEGPEISIVSMAGFAVELLSRCEKIPDFWEHMKEARKSADGIKHVHRDLDSLRPGFYVELQKGDYDSPHFRRNLLSVIKATKGTIENTVVARGELSREWQKDLEYSQKIAEKKISARLDETNAWLSKWESRHYPTDSVNVSINFKKAAEILDLPIKFSEPIKNKFKETGDRAKPALEAYEAYKKILENGEKIETSTSNG